ncbi:MAG: GNAT family N-acetyltransferase [Planctomycetota bacterium]
MLNKKGTGKKMSEEEIRLIEPTLELRAEFHSMAAEYIAAGEKIYADMYAEAIEDLDGYVARHHDYAKGLNLPDGWVPSNTFWLLRNDGRLLGCSRLRHYLSGNFLKHEGGHIGYDIRPSERRKGYGALILRLTLEKARGLGLERVLMTCHADNIASERIIEGNGGKFASQIIPGDGGKPLRRYWIDLL